ncbi:ferrichrome ABC transporter permease [Marinobacterium nitratireducens]|uniref:Ferrichrome ABC transporter permease n=1 Tax=Marinobacterium nitratireducens TaxID=518897 RepID=A0A917ZJQ0_9GAMM|nr:iron ABC transporter permease [Marinobacterium nitratireducens]GGO84686.1 ferrichrome ABC transporter permease [Marinobacterium nitratireducens]
MYIRNYLAAGWTWCLLGLLVALAATAWAALSAGTVPVAVDEVLAVLGGVREGMAAILVWELRLPRFIAGALVGASLAVAGQLMQTVTRNPLASPGITGVVAGSSMAVVLVQVCFSVDAAWLPGFGVLGGTAAALLTFVLAAQGGFTPLRLALAGVAVTALATALTTAFLLFSGAHAQQLYLWLAGGLLGRGWSHVALILPWTLAGLALALLGVRYLNLLQLEDEVARALGGRVQLWRLGFVAVAVALTAAAVAVAGPVGFIGLVAPHLVRLLLGGDQRRTLPVVALVGAVLVTLSDLLARSLMAPAELPLGLFTALLGGPVFIVLLRGRAL